MSECALQGIAWWILSGIYLLVGFWLGYRAGWRNRWKHDVRTVTEVDGSTITISSDIGVVRPGDRIRIDR